VSSIYFSGVYPNGILLDDPSTQNPARLGPAGYVTTETGFHHRDAVFGKNVAAWTFANSGRIHASASAASGIVFKAGGTVTNYGAIMATGTKGAGVRLTGGGSVGNATGALIEGASSGVSITRATGMVSNYGTIALAGTGGTAVGLKAGGSVLNGAVGSSTALIHGVSIGGAAGIVSNFATISGAGVQLRGGGQVSNQTGGLIKSGGDAVKIGQIGATVLNYGSIINTGKHAVGVDLTSGGLVSNAAGGLMKGRATAVVIAQSGGTVSNSGIIEAVDSQSLAVHLTAGSVGNQTQGLIRADGSAVVIDQGGAEVSNAGTIEDIAKTGAAVYLADGGTVVNGSRMSPAGLIRANSDAVLIAQAAGKVVNAGAIVDGTTIGAGVHLAMGGQIINTAGGSIAGKLYGIDVDQGRAVLINLGAVQTTSKSGFAVGLLGGGKVVNRPSGLIEAKQTALEIAAGRGHVSNFGNILGDVVLAYGGNLLNGGSMSSSAAAFEVFYGPGAIVNSGVITTTAKNRTAVDLTLGGSIVNGQSGSAYGLIAGITIAGAGGTVTNYASIAGSGIRISAGGSVTNRYGGTILGYGQGVAITNGVGVVVNDGAIEALAAGAIGVKLAAGGSTLVNAGKIIANYGTAVLLKGSGDLLTVDPGAVFDGAVIGNGKDAIELAAGAQTGALFGLGTNVTGFDALRVDAGAAWKLSGDAGSVSVTNDGTIFTNGGIILALGTLGEDPGAQGVVAVGGGGVQFDAAVDAIETLIFTDATGLALLARPQGFSARISGFRAGDTIDLVGSTVTQMSLAGGILTLTNQGSPVAALNFIGSYQASDFMLSPDGKGGTDLTVSVSGEFASFGAAEAAVSAGGMPPDRLAQASERASPFWVMRG
jgi:fibronectin-binding autotransporter adhesin